MHNNNVPEGKMTSISGDADGPLHSISHKSGISHYMPSVITLQQASVDTGSTLLHRQVLSKYTTNRTNGVWAL